MTEVPKVVKSRLIGLTLNEAANNIYFKLFSNGKINIREFDSTLINSIVNYKLCCKSYTYLNVYSRNGKIFAVGKISESYC
jgi:hypothetical protein